MRRLMLVLALSVFGTLTFHAQTPQNAEPRFEAVSIKPSSLDENEPSFAGRNAPNRYVERNVELRQVILAGLEFDRNLAARKIFLQYGLGAVPPERLSRRFAINAVGPNNAPPGQLRAMIRTMLVERFHMRWHTERRLIDVYAITQARAGVLGPLLRPTTANCRAFMAAGGTVWDDNRPRDAEGQDLCWNVFDFARERQHNVGTLRGAGDVAAIMDRLQGVAAIDRPLVDATGLTGSFEWHLTFLFNPNMESEAPSVFEAVDKQLGLKLVARKEMHDVTIVDAVDLPTPD